MPAEKLATLKTPTQAHALLPAGWVVRSKVLTAGYKFFIMLNSSVRGPFLPPYLVRAANMSAFCCGIGHRLLLSLPGLRRAVSRGTSCSLSG